MEKFTIKFKDFMYESLQDKMKDKISEQYNSLKRGILDLVEKSIDSEELTNVQNFIKDYSDEKATLIGFVDDNEIFDFYLKYQANIDEICTAKEYFKQVPEENNIFSLYSFIINGTKYAVSECLKLLNEELFK